MRFRIKFLEHFHRARKASTVHIYKHPYLVPIIGVLVGLVIVGSVTVLRGNAAMHPYDSHVVFLFDSDTGKRQTLTTRAATVGDLVKKLPLHLIPQDVIEPSLDSKIVEDNFRINVYRARPVTVIDNGVKTVTVTAQKSPRVAAQAAGIQVYAEDTTNFAQGNIRENTI